MKKEYVYLVEFPHNGRYKIGKTTNMDRRLKEIGQYVGANLVHLITTDDSKSLERFFHRYFRSKLVEKEIFSLVPEDVERFKLFSEVEYNEVEISRILDENNPVEFLIYYICCPSCGISMPVKFFTKDISAGAMLTMEKAECKNSHSFSIRLSVYEHSMEISVWVAHDLPGLVAYLT